MPAKPLLRYYRTVYHLAQNATEAFTLFIVLQKWFKAGWAKDFNNAVINEDVLRVIAQCTRRTAVVAIHILCDNGRRRTCNVFSLLERLSTEGTNTGPMRQRLRTVRATIDKIRLLRMNNDAHLAEEEEWKKAFGELKAKDVNRLLTEIYGVVCDCGSALGQDVIPYDQLCKVTSSNSERLIRALSEQVSAGKVGAHFPTIREWEDMKLAEADRG
jgi:hypothetical protein